MNVSRTWLQKYFTDPLPPSEELADVLTFHSSEVEEVEGDRLEIKILPDRAPYALSHRGVAYEVAASLDRPLASDPLREPLPEYPSAENVQVTIEDTARCARYMGAHVTGVKVGPSPDWLKDALTSVGQRSINNVVDATNYVMLNIGQPLHAFDAAKLMHDGTVSIAVRGADKDEKITTLTGEEYSLPEGTLLITDATTRAPLGIAGVKGGKAAAITEETTDLIVESANFEGTGIRKASQALKLWTDASLRFQNKISPELAAYGMRDVLALILDVAGGTVVSVTDTYPNPESTQPHVSVQADRLNSYLGTTFEQSEIESALTRLSLTYVTEGDMITITPPFERRDIVIWQDVAEEVGRILGYDRVVPTQLSPMKEAPDQDMWKGIERIKSVLVEHGFVEISTPSFAETGDILLENPLQSEKPYLRRELAENVREAVERAAHTAPRTLGPVPMLRLFELGTVFTKDGEHQSLCLGYMPLVGKSSPAVLDEAYGTLTDAFPEEQFVRTNGPDTQILELSLASIDLARLGKDFVPQRYSLSSYQAFSAYPSAIRDIAVWTPAGTEESEVALLIQKDAGDLLARMDLFDRFEKTDDSGTRISFAFRLIFQAADRTLSDADIDPRMAAITKSLNAKDGWQVR